MNRKLLISSIVAVIVSAFIFTSSSVSAAPVLVNPGDSIQDAIDGATAGDTIIFAAGTYTETVTIDKPLTLQGARAGVDARNRSGAETIIQPSIGQNRMFNINSDNVTIDGFTFEGLTSTPATAVDVHAPSAMNLHLLNNVLTNNSTAVMATNADITGLRVSQNVFDGNNVSGQGTGIFVSNSTGSDVEIAHNSFFDTDANTPGSYGVAINVFALVPSYNDFRILDNSSSNDGAFIAIDSTTNITIANNTVTNEAKAAITIDANDDTVTIKDNTLTNSLIGIRLRGAYDGVNPAPITNLTAIGNTISGMTLAGVQILAGAIGDVPEINNNSLISNAVGVINESTMAVDANNNWWGCSAGSNSLGCDTTTGSVLASVWYTDAAMTTLSNAAPEQPGTEQTVPGVPNTGSKSVSLIGYLIAGGLGVLMITLAGFYVYRRHQTLA